MRLAPVPLAYYERPVEAIQRAGESSLSTRGTREAVDGCRYLAALIVGALDGKSKETLLSDHFEPVPGVWQAEPLAPRIADIASGSFKALNPPAVKGSGYVVESLEAAIWAFYHGKDFREGALLAVNLGDDADTTGAVYGQLAGAFYGEDGIPEEWRGVLAHHNLIESYADKLYELRTVIS